MRAWNYTRMCIAAIAIAASVLCMPGCNSPAAGKAHGRRAVTALLDSAETMMNQAPEQAYRLLDSIDSRSLRSRALNARYALLFTEAQYKCYIQAPGDSLIMTAVKYYSVGNHPEQLFRSYYCLGCIYNEAGRLVDAAVALEQAEQLADKIDDGYRKGLLYTQLGEVFYKSYDYQRSENYYIKASYFYSQSGKEIHKAYSLYDIANCKIEQHDFRGGDSIMMLVQSWAQENNESRLYADALISRFSCSVFEEDIDKSKELYESFISSFEIPSNDPLRMSLMSRFYLMNKDFSQVFELIDAAWKSVSSTTDSINMYYTYSQIYDRLGRQDSALIYYKKSIALQNKNIRKILNQPVIDAQKEYYRTISEFESLKNRNGRTILILCIIIFSLLLLMLLFYNRYQRKSIKEQLYDSISVVEELTITNRIHTDKIERLLTEIRKQFHERYDMTNILYSIYLDIDSNQKITKQQLTTVINNLIKEYTSADNLKQLDNLLNESYNGIMDRLNQHELGLSDKELQLFRFSLAGLSSKSISLFLNDSQQNLYKIKSRVMKKIRTISPELWIELNNTL